MASMKTAFIIGALAARRRRRRRAGRRRHALNQPRRRRPPAAPDPALDRTDLLAPARRARVLRRHLRARLAGGGLDPRHLQGRRPRAARQIPGFENFPFEIVPAGDDNGGGYERLRRRKGRRPSPPAPASSSPPTATSSPTTTSSRAPRTSRSPHRRARAAGQGGRPRRGHRPGRAQGPGLRLPVRRLRELGQAAGRRLGGRGRQSLRPERHGHGRHRLGLRTATSATTSSTSSRSTRPINRGNSGGPTFDIYGRVIGVNSAIYLALRRLGRHRLRHSRRRRRPHHQAADRQRQDHPRLYRRHHPGVTADIADSMGMSGRKGALVTDLVPGGPAQKAGLHARRRGRGGQRRAGDSPTSR